MLSSLDVNGVLLHETALRAVAGVSGLFGISPPRRSVRIRPTADGAIDDTLYLDEKIITISGDVWAPAGADVSLAFAEFRTLAAAFESTLTVPGLLSWTEGASGLALQRTVKLAGPCEPDLHDAAAILSYGVVFSSSDPRAYSQALQTAVGTALTVTGGGDVFPDLFTGAGGDTFSGGGGGTSTFTNAGNSSTRPLLRIYGGVTAPVVVLGSKRISLTGTIATGDYVEIDLGARTLTLMSGGLASNAAGLLDPANTQWFSLPPGVSVLQLIAGTFDGSARLDVVGRSAYA